MINASLTEVRIIQENIKQLIGLVKHANEAGDYVMEHTYLCDLKQELINLTKILQQLMAKADQSVINILMQMENYLKQSNNLSQESCLKIRGFLSNHKGLTPFYKYYLQSMCGFSDSDLKA